MSEPRPVPTAHEPTCYVCGQPIAAHGGRSGSLYFDQHRAVMASLLKETPPAGPASKEVVIHDALDVRVDAERMTGSVRDHGVTVATLAGCLRALAARVATLEARDRCLRSP